MGLPGFDRAVKPASLPGILSQTSIRDTRINDDNVIDATGLFAARASAPSASMALAA